jgi:prepilin-type N-terminal cleavage/methylation domain-containing protein
LRRSAHSLKRGFSLIELSVVVAVTLVIAAVAAVRFNKQTLAAKHRATLASYLAVEKAAELYRADWQSLPPDKYFGQEPPGMSAYLNSSFWTSKPPIGGTWDWNNNWGLANSEAYWGVSGPNISIHQNPVPLSGWLAFDKAADDNSLSTGKFSRINTYHLCYTLNP